METMANVQTGPAWLREVSKKYGKGKWRSDLQHELPYERVRTSIVEVSLQVSMLSGSKLQQVLLMTCYVAASSQTYEIDGRLLISVLLRLILHLADLSNSLSPLMTSNAKRLSINTRALGYGGRCASTTAFARITTEEGRTCFTTLPEVAI